MKRLLFLFCLTLGTLSLWATNDTIDLTDPSYGIDQFDAYYYESGGQPYYSFSVWNFDDDYPELRIEAKVTTKEKIQGTQVVDLDYSFLDIDDVTHYTFSKALFWLKYTGTKTIDGDPIYDIIAIVDASDNKVYQYRGTLPVYTYDRGAGNAIIPLTDVVDDSVVDPTINNGGATAIDNVNNNVVPQKLFRNGQVLIQRGEKVYTVTGQEVK